MDAASRKLEFISEDVVDYAVQIILDECLTSAPLGQI